MHESDPDPLEVLRTLHIHDAMGAERVRGGFDTLIWRVERPGGPCALRLFRAEQQATARKEEIVMRAAGAAGVPAPAVLAAGVWQGRAALLLEWCAGDTLLGALQRAPHRLWQLGTAFGRAQAAIHAVPPPPELLPSADAWVRWCGPGEEALQRRLRALAPHPYALLHLDYHPLNVLAADGRISATLDWANAQAGDPRADVARTHSILLVEPLGRRMPLPLRAARLVLALAWRAGYRAAAGPLRDMAPFYAWAGAVMQVDLAPRVGRPHGPSATGMERVRAWTGRWKRRAGIA
jgi:aminoglycoside phosphotransferase (APT) family kinase protein